MLASIILVFALFCTYISVKGTIFLMFSEPDINSDMKENIHLSFVIAACLFWGAYHYLSLSL